MVTLCANCGYPPSVCEARAFPIWDAKTFAGPKSTAPAALPAGLYLTDGLAHTITGSIVTNLAGKGDLLGVGVTNGAVVKGPTTSLTYEDGTIDCTGLINGNASCLRFSGQAAATFRRARFINAPRLHVFWPGGVGLWEDCYFGPWAQNPRDGDHLEAFHTEAGEVTLRRTFIDGDSWQPWPVAKCGETGAMLLKAGAGTLKATLDGLLITGSATHHWPYPIQAKAQTGDVDIYVSNCILEKGSSGYFGSAELNGFKVRVHDLGGNRDLITGQPVDHSYPRSI